MRELADQLKDTAFLEELLKEFVTRGLGSLPGRETTIAVVGLLLKHHPEWKTHPPMDYEIARLLRTSPKKIRNIRDELAYRDPSRSEEWCRQQLASDLQRAETVGDGSYVSFQIDDGLVRDYAQKLVRQNYGVFESGMNGAVAKVSGEAFAALALSVLPEADALRVANEVPNDLAEKLQDERLVKGPIRIFIESFAQSAGEEAGAQSVDLAFTLLTGGANKIGKALNLVRNVFGGDG